MRHKPLNRRTFLTNTAGLGLGIGFAIASHPLLAQAIKTDFDNIETGEIMIPAGNGKLPAYMAKPSAHQNHLPVVIVVSEIFGVHEYIADVARRLAKLGYLVIAPELFFRAGDPNDFGTIAEIQSNIIEKTSDQQVLDDIDHTIQWASQHGGNSERIAITGFCWGGRITWLSCAHLNSIKTGVAWYGRLKGPTNERFPKNPFDLIDQLKCPVLGLYGAKDEGILQNDVLEFKKMLKNSSNSFSKNSDIILYPNAGHGFHADYRNTYHKASAQDGWLKMLDWLKRHGV